ncbi:uncharacterized protein TrAFT101_010235 [Trichoderma asperellum]|uniref:uncharacterized protein n=1 Tax=Trichoderma asperellum TaxID=101201 RepID=UPI00332F3601|nr:hypothetical protein TrAFT101_010235 [Trichoderma asperellum]
MLAPPAAVPSTWRRCDALFVVADGIGRALQGPANETRAGKSQCSSWMPNAGGKGLVGLGFISRRRLVRLLAPLPRMAHALSLKKGKGKKRKLLLGRAMDPAAAYRADLAGVASRARLRDKDGKPAKTHAY